MSKVVKITSVLSYALYQMTGLVPSVIHGCHIFYIYKPQNVKVAPENIIQLNSIRIVLNHIEP